MKYFIQNQNQATNTELSLLRGESGSKDISGRTPAWTFPYLDRWGSGMFIECS